LVKQECVLVFRYDSNYSMAFFLLIFIYLRYYFVAKATLLPSSNPSPPADKLVINNDIKDI